jgi:glutamyl/glutaminyl-tRNA synthetase
VLELLFLLYSSPGETLRALELQFSLERAHKGGAIVNINKLDWFNGQHLRAKCTDVPPPTRSLRSFFPRSL